MKLVIEIPEKTSAHIRSDYGHGYLALRDEDKGIVCCAIYHGEHYKNQPHGEWIKGREISRTMLCDETLCIDYENFTCSVCGLVLDRLLYNVDGSLFYKFCPNCGTKMVKEGEAEC